MIVYANGLKYKDLRKRQNHSADIINTYLPIHEIFKSLIASL